EVDVRDRPTGILLLHADGGNRLELGGIEAGVCELKAQRHREAARVRSRDQLLGIRAGLAVLRLEARVDAVRLILEGARERRDRAGARRALAMPNGGACSLECHKSSARPYTPDAYPCGRSWWPLWPTGSTVLACGPCVPSSSVNRTSSPSSI